MNKNNVLAVATAIEKRSIPGLAFNMSQIQTCIECWAQRVSGGGKTNSIYEIERQAHEFLGIEEDSQLSTDLFLYVDSRSKHGVHGVARHRVTPSQAVSVLRHLAETGVVDWKRALAEVAP